MNRKIKSLLLMGSLLLFQGMMSQDKTVSGTVTAASDGNPLPGVSIVVQGTTQGTQTDFDGNYSIQVGQGQTLQFSYIGMKGQDISVGTSNTINVIMEEDASTLDEVVVTALGLKRQKKSLTYATQTVETESIDEARAQKNLVNSLQGKVAGLSIQTSGNGVNSSSRVLLRGNRSISGNSQALYVVDGVPLGGDINNLSPDDIASISVLKGANAAALYGARANNGAIIITTKSGVDGKTRVNYTATVTTEIPNILFDYQNQYGQGSQGVYNPSSVNSWGPRFGTLGQVENWSPNPEISQPLPYEAQPNNVKDFFQTGLSMANSLSVTSGGEQTQTFFNYTHDNRSGIVPNNELSRHNVSIKVDNKFLNDKFKLSARVNYIRSDIDNEFPAGAEGAFDNPIRYAYQLPRNIRTVDARVFQYTDPSTGSVRQNFWKPLDNGGANPYWTINKNLSRLENNRVIGYTSLTYNFLPNLNLLVRTAVDQASEVEVETFANDTYIIAQNGNYKKKQSKYTEWNSDFLLTYDKVINDNYTLNLSVGGNNRQATSEGTNVDNGGLNTPNIFTVTNAAQLSVNESFGERQVHSLYTFGQFSIKDALFLDATYRSDWSSTLPEANRRFDYYSTGLGAVVSDMVALPSFISFLKLRGSYAQVGNDTSPYQLVRAASTQAGGFINISDIAPNANLRPERTNSTEFGLDLRLFDSRLGFDLTYYKTNSVDQLFRQDVPIPSGVSVRFVNGGDVENKGFEAVLTANPIRTKDFNWNLTANFSKNESEVVRLNDNLETLSFGGPFINRFFLDVGEPWGNIYTRGFVRDDQGRVIVGDNGVPQKTGGFSVVAGNVNPDWLGGISNTFSYKNIDFSFLIDIRQGGVVTSVTNSILAARGVLEETLIGRDGGLVFGQDVFSNLNAVKTDGTPNDIAVDPELFWNSMGGENTPLGEAFVEDASNVRMREITLGYSFGPKLLDRTFMRSAKISLVGRNLFFFSNSAPFDPEILTGTGVISESFESFVPPVSRSIGMNLKIGF
ncbi:MAG: SusC/RagA family TonB-linked outer membrane protein [Sediminicola sp.]